MGALDANKDNIWTFGTPSFNSDVAYAKLVGEYTAYFMDGDTYQVSYTSADIFSGSVRVCLGDATHTVVAGGATVTLERGATTKLYLQALSSGFVGRVNDLKIIKLS